MISEKNKIAEAGMMIRRPAAEVYNAFVDPAITTCFWFTRSSGRLDESRHLTWSWDMYNASAEIDVLTLEPARRIHIQWGSAQQKTTVEWVFTALDDSRTFVSVRNYGFKGEIDDIISQVRDATGGFTTVLDGLKAYLEHGIQLNLVLDKFPKDLAEHG